MDIGAHPYIVRCAAINYGVQIHECWIFKILKFLNLGLWLLALVFERPPLKALTKQKSNAVI